MLYVLNLVEHLGECLLTQTKVAKLSFNKRKCHKQIYSICFILSLRNQTSNTGKTKLISLGHRIWVAFEVTFPSEVNLQMLHWDRPSPLSAGFVALQCYSYRKHFHTSSPTMNVTWIDFKMFGISFSQLANPSDRRKT